MNKYTEIVVAYIIYFACFIILTLVLGITSLAGTFSLLFMVMLYFSSINQVTKPQGPQEDWSKRVWLNRFGAACGYFPVGIVVPLVFARRKSKLCFFHVQQALIIQILIIIMSLLFSFLMERAEKGFLNEHVVLVAVILQFVLVGVYGLYGVFNALRGKEKELPVLGKFRIFPKHEFEEYSSS